MKCKYLILLGAVISVLSVVNVNAQTTTNASDRQQNGMGNWLNYPSGTRLYRNGTISSPSSGLISPTVPAFLTNFAIANHKSLTG